MLRSYIDHITITAPSLADGAEYVRQALGVTLQAGGEHPRMGTHNVLLKLGDALFLEVIAVNPDAPPPNRPRWFELDAVNANHRSRLTTWVVRTNDIYAAVKASPVSPGNVEPMTRGQLRWLITLPGDGSLPLQGAAPALIQWDTAMHPATGLQDLGCSLIRLDAFHAEAEKISSMLACIGFQGNFSVSPLAAGEQPYLVAHIQTPSGPRQLDGRDFSLNLQ